jgi:serine/threonine protein phosphatase PrpC
MKLKSFYALSNQGPYLNTNEDDYDFDFQKGLYMMFDGVGGSGIGDKVVSDAKTFIGDFYGTLTTDREATHPFYYSAKFLLEGNALINAALMAHDKIHKSNATKNIDVRGASAAVLVGESDCVLNVFSTGNCRGYLLRNGKGHRIVLEDTLKNTSDLEFARNSSNLPASGLGLFPDLHFNMQEFKVVDGDQFIFVTDGVYGLLDDDEILSIAGNPAREGKERISQLFALANDKGNLDNQTAMILEY